VCVCPLLAHSRPIPTYLGIVIGFIFDTSCPYMIGPINMWLVLEKLLRCQSFLASGRLKPYHFCRNQSWLLIMRFSWCLFIITIIHWLGMIHLLLIYSPSIGFHSVPLCCFWISRVFPHHHNQHRAAIHLLPAILSPYHQPYPPYHHPFGRSGDTRRNKWSMNFNDESSDPFQGFTPENPGLVTTVVVGTQVPQVGVRENDLLLMSTPDSDLPWFNNGILWR